MTCAKVVVTATLLTLDSEVFVGENSCNAPQPACPRTQGEGYAKCKSICKQEAHAEIQAISKCRASGGDPRYSSMSINYTYVCDGCKAVLDELGIRYIVCPPKG